jgi:hypothetical protein
MLHSSLDQLPQFIPSEFQLEAIDCRVLRPVNRPELRDAQSLRTCGPNQFRRLQICPAQCIHLSFDEIVSNQRERGHPIEILLSLVLELTDCLEPILVTDIKRLVSSALYEAGIKRRDSDLVYPDAFADPAAELFTTKRDLQALDHKTLAFSTRDACRVADNHGKHDDDGIVLTRDSRGKICDHMVELRGRFYDVLSLMFTPCSR